MLMAPTISMLYALFVLKFVVAVATVLITTAIAERINPRLAGIIAGLPQGSAIGLFFFGLEQGPEFAAKSAVFVLAGMLAVQAGVYCYYQVSKRTRKHGLVLSLAGSLLGYLAAAFALRPIEFTIVTAPLALLLSLFIFTYLFKEIRNTKISQRIRLTPQVLAFRAALAGAIVLAVTEAAYTVGSEWAGLFSAFGITTWPTLLIVHHAYGGKQTHPIIKNLPIGLGGMLVYCLTVYFAYQAMGVYAGTSAAIGTTLAYLGLYTLAKKKWNWLP